MKIVLTFDPIKHTYIDNRGFTYTSVTTLISKRFPFNMEDIARKVINAPRSRYYGRTYTDVIKEWTSSSGIGTKLHEACENYIKTNIITDDIICKPCVEQFSKLRFDGKILSEQIVFDEDLLIAGTIDLLEDCNDKMWIWDIKTSTNVSEKKLLKFYYQLEIYKRLAEKRYNKPAIPAGILLFEDFASLGEKTKLKIKPYKDCKYEVDDILYNHKRQLVSMKT